MKLSSQGCIKSVFKNHIDPFFEGRVLNEITSQDVSKWIMYLDNKKLKYLTKSKIIVFLSRFFNFCVENELLHYNPYKKAIKLKNDEIKKEMMVWDENEFKQFVSVIDDIVYKTFFSFLYLTGCRLGEALALNWKDISENKVSIYKSLGRNRVEGGYFITSPKNSYSDRTILMPEVLVKLLKELKEYYLKYQMFSEENFVFGNVKHLPPQTIRRKLGEFCNKAGVKRIRIHDFRHSHASLLISKGFDIVTIARRLGHADIEMTLNTYSHLMPNKQAEMIASGLNFNL